MIADPEEFFMRGCGRCDRFATPDCSARLWRQGLDDLRRICLDMGLTETAKWGHPCYMRGERNIALFGAFRGDFRLSFMNPALMKDPAGVLEPNGPNARHKSMIRFTRNDQVAGLEPVIRAYLAEAIDYADRGIVPAREAVELELPDELVEVLDGDPELAEAFHALTPGRQKSYVFALNSTKNPVTRFARIEKYRGKIMSGKGALDR
ncbi:MAG: YdeI/OmpD-associated family protein [Novosphingobium sp.]|nr:YdeI/OmpD-associated family protein [Novosphingobium sp.]MBO9603616.1 YdeI/OmpD-associated family protein [Novosphingobium sp.]